MTPRPSGKNPRAAGRQCSQQRSRSSSQPITEHVYNGLGLVERNIDALGRITELPGTTGWQGPPRPFCRPRTMTSSAPYYAGYGGYGGYGGLDDFFSSIWENRYDANGNRIGRYDAHRSTCSHSFQSTKSTNHRNPSRDGPPRGHRSRDTPYDSAGDLAAVTEANGGQSTTNTTAFTAKSPGETLPAPLYGGASCRQSLPTLRRCRQPAANYPPWRRPWPWRLCRHHREHVHGLRRAPYRAADKSRSLGVGGLVTVATYVYDLSGNLTSTLQPSGTAPSRPTINTTH